jgi:hypothetical protein
MMEAGLGSEKTLAPGECPIVTVKYGWKHPSMTLNTSGFILMKIGNVFLVNDIFIYMAGTLKTTDMKLPSPSTISQKQTTNCPRTLAGKRTRVFGTPRPSSNKSCPTGRSGRKHEKIALQITLHVSSPNIQMYKIRGINEEFNPKKARETSQVKMIHDFLMFGLYIVEQYTARNEAYS